MIKEHEQFKYRIALKTLESAGVGVDVYISDIYHRMVGAHKRTTPTQMQMYVGAAISYANRRLVDHVIVPGEKKRTYRIVLKPIA